MIKNKRNIFFAAMLCAVSLVFARIQPLPEVVEAREAKARLVEAQKPDRSSFVFFRENFASGGYSYVYGGNTRIFIPEESGHIGEVAVVFELDPVDYAGGAIVLWGTEYDLTDVFPTGALEFWIKGESGGEIGHVGLADNEMVDGIKTQVLVSFDRYGGIKPYWTHMSIPLADLGRRGSYWNARTQSLINNYFKWGNVKEFIVTTPRGANKKFKIWLDDIKIVKDRYPKPSNLWDPYWDEIVEVIPPVPATPGADVNELTMIYERGLVREPQRTSAYGGRTVFGQQTAEGSDVANVLAFYLDGVEFSGVTFNWGRNIDFRNLRNNSGGIAFWAKAVQGVTQVFIGLNDNKGDGKSVGTTVNLNDFGNLDTGWNYFMIPIKEFSDDGSFWDEATNSSKPGVVDWSRINSFSITSNRFVNRIRVEDPVKLFVSRVALIEKVPGYIDPDIFWDAFQSDAPDVMINDFEGSVGEEWMAISGEGSAISVRQLVHSDRNLRDKYGRAHLAIDWSNNDWAMANLALGRRNVSPELSNWSGHSAVAFDVFSNRDEERMAVTIGDGNRQEWMAIITLNRGWNEVVVPFRRFRKMAYQPPEAVSSNRLELGSVWEMGFRPLEMGVVSQTLIDNVRITQEPKR